MGRPVPPHLRTRTLHRLLGPATAVAAGAALVAGAVQTPPPTGGAALAAAPVAAVSCAAGVWKADYYANTTLTGTPRKSLCDSSINENWGNGHPAGISLPNDHFGVRWTMRRNFGSGGPFLLRTAGQDGVRVWVDSKGYVNLWHNYASTQRATVKLTMPAGTHTVRVDYAAVTGAANVAVSLAPTTPDKVAPLAPASPKAARGDGRATVSWSRNAEMDLAGYRVYRSTTYPVKTDTAHRISGSGLLTGASLTSTGLHNGTKYWFVVTAVDRSGNQSRSSATVSAVPADTTPPRAPDILGADGYGDIDLNGNGVPDAGDDLGENHLSWGPSWDDDYSTKDAFAGYNVYRATAPGGPWTRIRSADAKVVQDNAYSDKGAPIGITAYYRVTAVDTAGNESAPATTEPGEYSSTTASALRPDTGLYPPQQPTGLKGTLSGGNAALDWADNPVGSAVHGLTAGYQVQSSSSASGPWTVIAGVGTPFTGSQFTATGLPEGGTRYYEVRAAGKLVDSSTPRAYSAWTAPVAVSRPLPPDTTPPAAPAAPEATATADGTTATLTWTYNNGWPGYDQDFAGYQVTRSDGPDGPFTDTGALRTPNCAYVPGTEQQVRCTLTDGPIAADASPYYRVVSVDFTGNRSSGTVVQLKRQVPPPPKPPTPTGLTATRTDGGILLQWDPVPADQVYRYYLDRTTYGGQCDPNTATFSSATTSYLDTSPWRSARYCLLVSSPQGGLSDQIFVDVPAPDTTPPQAPEVPTLTGTADGIVLTWSANDSDAAAYEIWRRTETDSDYGKVGDTPSPGWTDTGAPAGVPSCYRTVAVDAAGNRSDFSEDTCAVRPYPEGTVRPDRPTGVTAAQDGSNAVLSWQPAAGATGYLVYRYWSDDAHPGVRVQDTPVTGTTVTDTAAPDIFSNTYYAVVAVDADGVRSPAAVIPWMGDSGYGASMKLSASGSTAGVQLSWKWSCQSDWCPAPTSVAIQRWNPDTQVWDKLTSTLPGTATTYLDTAAPAGTTSYYQVQVYGIDGDTPSQLGYGAVPGTRPAANPAG